MNATTTMLDYDTTLEYDGVWYHVFDYDRPCALCEKQMNMRNETEEYCKVCDKIMCEDCQEETLDKCQVCFALRDEKEKYLFPNTCHSCMKTCFNCNESFHPMCEDKHVCGSNRDKRGASVGAVKKVVKDNEVEISETRLELLVLEEELAESVENLWQKATK